MYTIIASSLEEETKENETKNVCNRPKVFPILFNVRVAGRQVHM